MQLIPNAEGTKKRTYGNNLSPTMLSINFNLHTTMAMTNQIIPEKISQRPPGPIPCGYFALMSPNDQSSASPGVAFRLPVVRESMVRHGGDAATSC